MKNDLYKHRKARNREDALEQGYYDGRFKTRVGETRKLREEKRKGKKRFNIFDEEGD
jgi:hypothetical protein